MPNKVNAAAYNFIRQVSATATEVRCVANLVLRDGGTLAHAAAPPYRTCVYVV